MADTQILIVDDQAAVREELAYALSYEGYGTLEASNGDAALELMQQQPVHLVLLDIKMPGLDGMQVLRQIRTDYPGVPVVMISGHGDIETAVVAVKQGAYDFLPKPFDTDRVLVAVKNALWLGDLAKENRSLRAQLSREHQILGESDAIQEIHRVIERVAPTDATVLITGENGTGKELVARRVHQLSNRQKAPFVALNCAAIPTELIESELFGHERGAFTGAHQRRQGHFELAHGGTLFLDEIGDLALPAQAKLLRCLQEKVVTRIGGAKPISVDVRVVAATNQDLAAMVEAREFREDLFYRLHVIRIHVPPLRERNRDIDLLARHFLEEACRRNGLPQRKLATAAIEALRSRPWPGNVRELKNLIEGIAILADSDDIGPQEVEALGRTGVATSLPGADYFGLPTLDEFRQASEREFIRRKLDENNGNIKRTAERIQIQRSNLYKKLDRYGLK